MKKDDVWGIILAAGIGISAGLIYFMGKACGQAEGIGWCANELAKIAKDVENTQN